MPPYAELHLHTAYSFLDGASLPEELVVRASELGYRALAITDHDGLHGAMEFARAARAVGIAPITVTWALYRASQASVLVCTRSVSLLDTELMLRPRFIIRRTPGVPPSGVPPRPPRGHGGGSDQPFCR